MQTVDIVHDIIRQKVTAMRIDGHYIQPMRILVTSENMEVQLNNIVCLLDTKILPENINLKISSVDNVFVTNSHDYEQLSNVKYQLFTDYLQIETSMIDSYVSNFAPYYLEFLQIIPIKNY